MTPSPILPAVTSWRSRPESLQNWRLHQAVAAFDRGHYHVITDPAQRPYLARFWLSVPFPSTDSSSPWESASSHLLHWILRPDADRHLHDHPWEFTTRIISGGYVEETQEGVASRYPKTRHIRPLGFPHRIASLIGDPANLTTGRGGTWTEVYTGPRARPWGFYTPGGWIDHAIYFGQGQQSLTFDSKL